jgi:hypothetical protein
MKIDSYRTKQQEKLGTTPDRSTFFIFSPVGTTKKINKKSFFFCCRKKGACTRKVYMLMISEVVHSNYKPRIFFFRFIANSSACLRSSLLGLPLFIPPNSFKKLFVLYPGQINSSTIMYPFASSFSFNEE